MDLAAIAAVVLAVLFLAPMWINYARHIFPPK